MGRSRERPKCFRLIFEWNIAAVLWYNEEEASRRVMLKYIKLDLLLISIVAVQFCSCPDRDHCGGGDYKCYGIKSTYPTEEPVKYDYYADAIVFADGGLAIFDDKINYNDPTIVDLKSICNCDSITDIVFYDEDTPYRNGYSRIDNVLVMHDPRIFILAADKFIRSNNFFTEIIEFGNIGPDSTCLNDAVSIDVDIMGNVYIGDQGTSDIKIFDFDGNFVNRWTGFESPRDLRAFEDNIYILDGAYNSISSYDSDGNFIKSIVSPNLFNDVTCFVIQSRESLWISYNGGRFLARLNYNNEILEYKTDYCYFDVTFEFKKIVDISCYWYFTIDGGLYVVDRDANYIIYLEEFHPL